MEEFKFGWGEPYCVREALTHYYKRKTLKNINLQAIEYQPYDGIEVLIEATKIFLKETTGIDYKYVIITNGATSSLNIVLRSLRDKGYDRCFTHKYHFPYYPNIIKKNKYEHEVGLYMDHEKQLSLPNTLGIVDSPSNPLGHLLLYTDTNNNIIWDSVYHNSVYINTIPVKPDHRVNCGSYSKVFGLTGARIGWIATNSFTDYMIFKEENTYETCSVSYFSQEFIIDVMKNTDMYNFMRAARYRINNNREMFDRICYLFDGQAVPENGMFFTAWTSPYVCKLFDKMNVKSVELDSIGNDKFLRFNLAQTNELTTKMVKYIIREDSR